MTGVTGIPDDALERAVDAAWSALLGRVLAVTPTRQREDLWDAVTAALAEVAPDLAAKDAKPAIDYCLERGYTLLYTANDPDPAVCVRLAVRDANELRAEVEALRATVARVEALHTGDSARPTSDHYYCEPYECDRAGEGELRAYCTACRRFAPCDTAKALRGDES